MNCLSDPKIQNPELLKARSSASTYNLLNTLITGRSTFWDLSIRMKRDVIQVARSMMPYIKLGFIDLTTIDDLPAPANITIPTPSFAKTPVGTDKKVANQKIKIAYIDINDEQLEYVGSTLKDLNYRYLPINDPFKAMSVLLAQKPDLIMLELDLGQVSGLDMCAQLKKLSLFRQTPILIVTDTSGIFDRVKSRLMGATDFMLKPFNEEEINAMIQKYLRFI